MDMVEFNRWMQYYEEEPWGEERADMRMGILAAQQANINRDRKKRSKPFTPADFMPKFGAKKKARAGKPTGKGPYKGMSTKSIQSFLWFADKAAETKKGEQ